jgi:hypothetical protein
MKIKLIKVDSLAILKGNQKYVYNQMINSKNKKWIPEILGQDFLTNSKIDSQPLSFITTSEKPIDDDFENAKMLHESFKHLSNAQASDERFWVGLSLTKGYDYLVHRWELDEFTKFKYRWVFYTKNRRALFYHGLARLWWFAHLTYDNSEENPYIYTELAYKHPEIMKNMVYRNFSNSTSIRLAILKALYDFNELGHRITRDFLYNLYNEISLMGSVSIIDSFNKEDLEEAILMKCYEIYPNS